MVLFLLRAIKKQVRPLLSNCPIYSPREREWIKIKNIRYIIYPIIYLLILSACSERQSLEDKIDPFSFQDQDKQIFGTDELTGSIWVASFIFTECDTVCPSMMIEMANLQKEFQAEGIEVELVSFTVDPTIDSPKVLKKFIQQFTEDEENWHMLTGYSQEEIEIFAREQFQTMIQKPSNSNQVIHGTNFYLIDDQGFVVNEYNYIDESYIEEMIEDIKNI